MVDLTELLNTFIARVTPQAETPAHLVAAPEKGVRSGAFVQSGCTWVEVPQQRAAVPERNYICYDVESFTAFLLKCPDFDAKTTEILGHAGTITAISGATHERHTVKLALQVSDAWTAWQRLCELSMTVSDLRRELKTYRKDIVNKELGAQFTDIAVNISSGSEVKIDPKTNLVVTEASQKNVQVKGAVPEGFVIEIPVYDGGAAQRVEIDIVPTVDEKAEKPDQRLKLRLKIVDPSAVKRAAWDERIAEVRKQLGEDWLVGVGHIDFVK